MQTSRLTHGFHSGQPKTPRRKAEEAMTRVERTWEFIMYLAVGISIGSLTGLIESHPLLWTGLSIWVAISLAREA
jgi:hypothetical protein